MSHPRLAMYLMVGQSILFSGETATIHLAGAGNSMMLLGLLRGAGGALLAVALALNTGISPLRTKRPALQIFRGLVSLLYLWVLIYSFSYLPFTDATALSYTQAVYIVIFSIPVLSERINWRCWAAATLGITGAFFVSTPALGASGYIYMIALLGTSLNGLAFVLNRLLRQTDSEESTMFYANIISTIGNIPVLFLNQPTNSASFLTLAGLLIFGPLGMYMGIVAAGYANAAALAPYTFLRLVFGVAAGMVIFREMPDFGSIIGLVLILASCAIVQNRSSAESANDQQHQVKFGYRRTDLVELCGRP